MIFFLLQLKAILLCIARVYKRGCKQLAHPCYDGGLGAFIGASGALLLPGVQGGSHTAVVWKCRSPPLPARPWTRSIADKGGRGGRQAADRAVLPTGKAISEVEPAMTFSLEGCTVHPLYHWSGRFWQLCGRRRYFIDSFITKTATEVLASPRGRGRGHVRHAVLP